MTICTLSFVSCGKQEATATTESIPNAVESAQVELTETTTETIESTEVVENNTSEAEAKDESTEAEKTTEVTNIEEAEPLSEKDLAFSFLGYDTYNEYVEAGNDEAAYMLADNANMIVSGEFTDDGYVIESTVRGIKLGDSIDKVIELYGDTKQRSADIKDVFLALDRLSLTPDFKLVINQSYFVDYAARLVDSMNGEPGHDAKITAKLYGIKCLKDYFMDIQIQKDIQDKEDDYLTN